MSNELCYSEAEPLFKSALEAQGRVLGPEHPYTLSSINNTVEPVA